MGEAKFNKDAYKQILMEADPLYGEFVHANKLVEDYIREKGLIIYGGTAIDFALRLKGKALYPDYMLDAADLDFLSPQHAEDAYNIADILYKDGYPAARAIQAIFIGTMKVDIADNHWIADVSYVPPEAFARIQYLNYKGMRIIHPDFQKIDMHSALSFPYDNAPREVIFDRWRKDTTRYNMLDEAYPTTMKGTKIAKMGGVILSREMARSVIHGFGAYAILYNEYANAMAGKVDPKVIAARLTESDGALSFDTFNNTIDIIDTQDAAVAQLDDIKVRDPYINLLQRCFLGKVKGGDVDVVIHDTSGKLLSINSVIIGTTHYRVVCAQYLMKWLMSMSVICAQSDDPGTNSICRDTYIAYYLSLKRMIEHAAAKVPALSLSIKTYGASNDPQSYSIHVGRIRSYLYRERFEQVTPQNYSPDRKVAHPVFDYKHHYYHESGTVRPYTEESKVGGSGRIFVGGHCEIEY
jgi:hypothetical protein